MSSFADSRVWFITGTSSGMGNAILRAVLSANERVVATLRTPSALADLQSEYPPEQLLVLPLDVTETEQVTAAFKKTEEHFHRLDVVVNNAGYILSGEIEATPYEEGRKIVDALFWGAVYVTKEAAWFFREVNPAGHGGRVLNISSIGGYTGIPTFGYYNAGKFALEGFTDSFTREMPPEWNIKGIIVQLGGFETGWRGARVQLPPHPAYPENSPAAALREQWLGTQKTGDVHKAAAAILRIAGEKAPPLRVQLGSDALEAVVEQAKTTIRDAEAHAGLARSTDL
ncbi:hypothetical protein EVG20_g6099 [Dentipellis fragilis]|uniref:NAD(P)-binding protein n=1 Tax=Dentipellis fragilis TaxID=205917 RepID=A0A4Y9YQA5_9AGAM|nr:hypothetical protein EVG20_g6099 [Dentipellis fragilis]